MAKFVFDVSLPMLNKAEVQCNPKTANDQTAFVSYQNPIAADPTVVDIVVPNNPSYFIIIPKKAGFTMITLPASSAGADKTTVFNVTVTSQEAVDLGITITQSLR